MALRKSDLEQYAQYGHRTYARSNVNLRKFDFSAPSLTPGTRDDPESDRTSAAQPAAIMSQRQLWSI